jgi:NAD(P)-dependent dehydrogenase (short-subunit alcohol dehydrogenase family)
MEGRTTFVTLSFTFTGRTVIVTGAAHGIGHGISRRILG